MSPWRGALAFLSLLAVTACAGIIPRPAEQTTRPPARTQMPTVPPVNTDTPVPAGVNARGSALGFSRTLADDETDPASAERALLAFRTSCPSVSTRTDSSGLTIAEDWIEPCLQAESWSRSDALAFFQSQFELVQIGPGEAFATGYYEPEIEAAAARQEGFQTPIFTLPADLQTRTAVPGTGTNGSGVYRIENGEERAYFDRSEIEDGALDDRGLELAFARDPVAFYFLQVQGSGLLRMIDGSVNRIGYAGNNGFPYTSIGRLMRERELITPDQTTAEGIANWLRENPDQGREIMQANRRYIFFNRLDTSAPLGSLGRPVAPRATVAADPAYVPLGAPVLLDMGHNIADGIWIAQDTGSAIRGPNRFDTFWGAGDDAYQIASGMATRGRAWIFIPRRAAARLRAE